MQVINGSDFEQKNVLVGQAGETEGYGVVNDPHLMAMLSTGLYSRPHRTMIQEILFNAWDAHRMANCQDRPIDVYINDVSGLIVRDYGPGIEPKQIHPIYCMYGASTKRDDADQTGGFGLGSKSPYAYTDSFTVTNHYEAKKYMYIMNRVSEENDGGPGRTTVINGIDTDEQGIMVTVPLKSEGDIQRSAEYIRDIVQLSGMKINLHVLDHEMEELRSETVAPGEWKISDEQTGEIWAIYGGVRYKIEEQDDFDLNYKFVSKLARFLGTFYIGFRPGALKPAPHREGLVFNEATNEAIKEQLEIIEEYFRAALVPCVRSCMKNGLMSLKESGVEVPWVGIRWDRMGSYEKLKDMIDSNHPVINSVVNERPSEISDEMWTSMATFIINRTDEVERLVGAEKFAMMKFVVWAKQFPDYKHYKSHFLKKPGTLSKHVQTIHMIEAPRTTKQVIDAWKLAEEVTESTVSLRMSAGATDSWHIISNRRVRPGNRLNERQLSVLKDLVKQPDWESRQKAWADRLFIKQNGEEVNQIWMDKVVIIAQTLGALKDTAWNWQSLFTPKYGTVGNYHNFHRSNFRSDQYGRTDRPIPALIVHKRKGNYEKARQALMAAGYEVLEADAPVVKERPRDETGKEVPVVPRKKPVYPILATYQPDWADWDNEVENPTCYVCVTEHKIRNGYGSEKPDKELLKLVQDRTKRMVILHNSQRAKPLERKKVPEFSDKLHSIVEKICEDQQRVNQMRLYAVLQDESRLPEQLLKLPEVQKFFKVPYLRTKQKEAFLRDMKILKLIEGTYRDQWVKYDTRRMVRDALNNSDQDDSVVLVRSIASKCDLLDTHEIRRFLKDKKPGEVKVFSEKLLRFLRTV